jgi:hypothetical protein
MAKLIIKTHDVTTGEIVNREMSAAEIATYEADQALLQAKISAEKLKENAKADLLVRLGITADEAALLLS